MPSSNAEVSTTRAGRYGRSGRRQLPRWMWIAIAVVLIGGGVAWSWWASQTVSDDPVTAQVRSFDVRSEHSTEITLQVSRSDGGAATCEVYAQALDHTVVGERKMDIAPSQDDVVIVSSVIRTDRRAANALVRSCQMSD